MTETMPTENPRRPTPFLADITGLLARAHRHIERGTARAQGDADPTVVDLLNVAIATQLVCIRRYRHHHGIAMRIAAKGLAAAFLGHADEELDHADSIAVRIVQLGGAPEFHPEGLATRETAMAGVADLQSRVFAEDLVAERLVLDSYGAMIGYLGAGDPETRCMLEGVRKTEARHAEDLEVLLHGMATTSGDGEV